MAKKGGMPVFKTVDSYIAAQSKEAQGILQELRNIIKETVPDVAELPNYKAPSFTLVPGVKPQQQLMLAAYAKHVSFYPFDATVAHFENELKDFELGKGTVKLPFNKPVPKDLIVQMIRFRNNELLKGL